MGKKKSKIIEECKILYSSMKDELIKAGISNERLNRSIGRLFDADAGIKMDEARRIRKHLDTVYVGPHYKVKVVRRMVPENVWANFEAMGVTDLPEQILLKKAQKDLNVSWGNIRKRKKKKKDSEKDKEEPL